MKHFFKIVSSCTKKKIESCAKISIHFHTKNTAFSLTAIVGKITEKVNLKEWVRFSMNIQSMYKRAPDSKLKKGLVYLWIHNKDLQCKCPKIKLNKYVKFLHRRLLNISNTTYFIPELPFEIHRKKPDHQSHCKNGQR